MGKVMKKGLSTKDIALGAILTALVIVLQLVGQFIKFGPASISLVLIPIVIGSAICGPKISTWLGFVFGVVVIFTDGMAFMAIHAVGTIVTVLLKGALCGLASGLVYKLFEKKNVYLAVVLSAIACPLVNTGVFLLGCYIFFFDTIKEWGLSAGFTNVGEYMILGLVGINFLLELAVNVVLSPIIVRIINVRKNTK